MKSTLILAIAFLRMASIAAEFVVTPDYADFLKRTVSWEVQDYDTNIFKGWTISDFQGLLGDTDYTFADDDEYKDLEAESVGLTSPETVDWTLSACSSPVRTQDQCGGCWAFAVAGMVSDRCCLKGGNYGWLSPQELLSCDKDSNGCVDGNRGEGVDYVKANGLVPESCYPYIAASEDCPSSCVDGKDWVSSHVCKCKRVITCTGAEKLMECLKTGPVAGGMSVYADFVYYKSGVYSWDRNSEHVGYHSIRIVGYGPDYWKCANSWGTDWGMKGYFMIAKGECDVEARTPVVCDPIP